MTNLIVLDMDAYTISIHTASEGGDLITAEFQGLVIISIHTASEGGDTIINSVII